MRAAALRALALSLSVLFSQAHAAYGLEEQSAPGDELQAARTLISQKDWGGAISMLRTYTRANPQNADGHNLLGYSYRQLRRYDESLEAYQRALTLAPQHRGAHEYIGEAYLALGRLDKAKEHLDALDRICRLPCQEYRDLKRAYERALRGR